ncbi:MAG: hypothetical protein WA091_01615 [Minisyncoccales bacterium]
MLRTKTKRILLALILFFLFLSFVPALAEETGLVQCGNEGGTACTFNDLFTTIVRVIDYVFDYVVPFLAILGIVMAAITMMTSNGDPGKFAQGKTAIIAIGIGLIIVYLSWTIVKSFIEFLGGQSWTTQFFKN